MNFKTFMESKFLKPTQDMIDWFDKRTNRHIELVQKYAKKLEEYDSKRFAGLMEKCKNHDASKFEEPEYTPYLYVSWQYRCKDLEKEFNVSQDIKDKMTNATEHHVHHNAHHPEFFDNTGKINREDRDKKPDKIVDATDMDNMSIMEMCSDWAAMSEEKGNSIRSWADKNVNIRWKFTPEQTKLIYNIIEILERIGN